MTEFRLPHLFECWSCGKESQPTANVHAQLVEWFCLYCGQPNYVWVDQIHFRIGSRMYLAAKKLLTEGDLDLASVLLITAVDATLGDGYVTLTTWRRTQARLLPLKPEEMECRLKDMGWKEKPQEFERLAGANVDEEIARLRQDGRIAAGSDLSLNKIRQGFDAIRGERNRLVHLGKQVAWEVIETNHPAIAAAITILESMWQAAFNLRAGGSPNPSSG